MFVSQNIYSCFPISIIQLPAGDNVQKGAFSSIQASAHANSNFFNPSYLTELHYSNFANISLFSLPLIAKTREEINNPIFCWQKKQTYGCPGSTFPSCTRIT